MKNSEEMLASLFERRDEYIARQKIKRKNTIKAAALIVPLCMVTLLGVASWRSGMKKPLPGIDAGKSKTVEPTVDITDRDVDSTDDADAPDVHHWC